MSLLNPVSNIPNIDFQEYRDNLFYEKYEFRLRLSILGSKYTRYCDFPNELIDHLNQKAKSWQNVKKSDIDIVTENLPALMQLIQLKIDKKTNKNFTIRLEGNSLSVFSTDLSLLVNIKNKFDIKHCLDITQVIIGAFAGTKYFVNTPKHNYRVYFKSRNVGEKFRDELKQTLNSQSKLYPSNALKKWLNKTPTYYWSIRYTSSMYFIDYDDEGTLSYLAIMYGDMLGKKYKLEKRPDNQ